MNLKFNFSALMFNSMVVAGCGSAPFEDTPDQEVERK
jgi:hypothetical protein